MSKGMTSKRPELIAAIFFLSAKNLSQFNPARGKYWFALEQSLHSQTWWVKTVRWKLWWCESSCNLIPALTEQIEVPFLTIVLLIVPFILAPLSHLPRKKTGKV